MSKHDWVSVDIGLIVEIGTFREVLKSLRVGGNRWWLTCRPVDTAESGHVIVGFGGRLCSDRWNAVFFRLPVLDAETSGLPDEIYVVIAPALIDSIEPGRCMKSDRRTKASVGDFERFYFPLKAALAQLHAAGEFHSSGPPHSE